MHVVKDCDSPSIAMITKDSVFNNRLLKVFLLEHDKPVPKGQLNHTAVKVPRPNQLCTRRACNCLWQPLQRLDKHSILQDKIRYHLVPAEHLERLEKHSILQILVEETPAGRDIILRCVFAKNEKSKNNLEYAIYHLSKSQVAFLTEFNEHRVKTVGDLRMLSKMVVLWPINL